MPKIEACTFCGLKDMCVEAESLKHQSKHGMMQSAGTNFLWRESEWEEYKDRVRVRVLPQCKRKLTLRWALRTNPSKFYTE